MKHIKLIAGACLALAFTVNAFAQASLPPKADAQNVFCVGTNGGNGGAAAWTIVSPRSGNSGPPVVQSISYATDAAGQVIRGYVVTTNNNVSGWIDSTHVTIQGGTNGYVAGDTLVIHHKSIDWCERGKVSTILLTNIVTLAAAPQVAITNGDTLYRCTNWCAPTIYLPQIVTPGSGTNVLSAGGGPVLVGQAGKPLLIEVTGSSAAYLGNASGYYAQPATIGTQPANRP